MMFKRIVSFLSAVIVATSSVFAWDAYSFTGVYDVASSASSIYFVSSNSDSSSFLDVNSTVPTTIDTDFGIYTMRYTHHYYPGVIDGETYVWEELQSLSFNPGIYDGYVHMLYNSSVTYTADTSNSDEKVYGLAALCNSSYLPQGLVDFTGPSYFGFPSFKYSLSYDVSSYNSTAFSLDGLFGVGLFYTGHDNFTSVSTAVDVYADGQLVRSFSGPGTGPFDFSGYIYSGTSPVKTITFTFTVPFAGFDSDSSDYNGTYNLYFRYINPVGDSNGLRISFLTDDSILNGFNDQAQDDINDHESIESQWTGSMSSNFDALDMDSFAFPSGLLSGFSLITGIFQDLWNGMGDYKILYVFPLFLGIALLLIGRISKFSGGQSSSRSNRGDDDA